MIKKLLRQFKFLHYLGLHNKDCKRRLFTTKNDYLCLRTGNIHKKFILEENYEKKKNNS